MENIETEKEPIDKLKELLKRNKDKRIVVVRTTCSGNDKALKL
jgi:hypothetical protein